VAEDERSEFEKQVEVTAAMARRKKSTTALLLNEGAAVPAAELLAISNLELRVANMEALIRLQNMTREA
jgi:hypothetical protein